jgi:hypothetical protein
MKILGRTAGRYKDNTIAPYTLITSNMKHNVVTKTEYESDGKADNETNQYPSSASVSSAPAPHQNISDGTVRPRAPPSSPACIIRRYRCIRSLGSVLLFRSRRATYQCHMSIFS